jgi:YjzC-like protein
MGDVFKPGDEVPSSGIYRVVHDDVHREEHDVTCVKGETFPPCNQWGHHPRFTLRIAAHHIDNHEFFTFTIPL